MFVSHPRVKADLEKLLRSSHEISETVELVENISREYSGELKALQNLESLEWKNVSEDSLGQGLIPTDLPSNIEGVQAKKATGDGNCLYNSASIILNSNEDLSSLLRLLTATELYENAPFYATHPNLSEAASDCGLPEISLFIQCLSESGLKVFDDTNDRVEAVKGEAIAGCLDRKWSVMMHMMALSTVIGRPIFSLYPECNTNTRPLCHKLIVPCDYATKKPDVNVNMAMILWSRDSNLDNRSGSWYQPNHFIPIFEVKGKPPQPSTTPAPDKDHHDGVQRRKRHKISDFFGPQHQSPQPAQKESIPPVLKKQRLEEDEKNPPILLSKCDKRVHEGKADLKTSPEGMKESEKTKTPKEKYEMKRQRCFQPHWKEVYPWVEHDSIHDVMFCKVCRTYPNICDKSSPLYKGAGGIGKYRVQSLKFHDASSDHGKCVNKWKVEKENAAKPLTTMMKTISAKLDELTKSRMERLFNTAHYVAKEGLAFKKFTGLCDLQEKNGVDMGNNYHNEIKCREFVSSIGAIEREKCAKEIKDARFLCVLADGATDKSVTEQLTVFVRYTASNGRPSTQFSDLVSLQSGNAVGITDAIDKGLEAVQVDENVLSDKLVGCNFDGASVMIGAKGGVSKKLEEKVGHPLCIIHCVAHKLELAILDAVKRCPYLSTFEDTVKEVYKFYYYSPKRRREVNEIASIIDENVVYYSGLQKTRWLASRYRAITALEKHYVTTVMHLQHKTGSTGEDGARAKGILKQFLSEKFVKHLYFLLDVMKILSELSKSFQQDQLCMTDVVATLETTMTTLEEFKLQRGCQYRKFLERYSEETAMFICGKDKGHELRLTRPGNMLDQQFDTFLSEVLTYLKSRFGNLQEKPYSLFRIFDPREMPQNLAGYGHDEIRSLVQYFEHFLTQKEQENIVDQWPMLRTRLSRQKANNPVDVFSNLLASRPDDVKDCLVLLDLMNTLSPSTATCERSFSAMNQLKSNVRTRISQSSLVDLMRIRSSNVSTKEYTSGPAISHWILDAKTKRHIL